MSGDVGWKIVFQPTFITVSGRDNSLTINILNTINASFQPHKLPVDSEVIFMTRLILGTYSPSRGGRQTRSIHSIYCNLIESSVHCRRPSQDHNTIHRQKGGMGVACIVLFP